MQLPTPSKRDNAQPDNERAPVVPILTIRGQRVILSPDLAEIYGVAARALNQAVKRNARRFPPDFAFRLTTGEALEALRSRSQAVILKRGGNVKYPPLAFTEHGAIMAASVLNSPRAIQMSIFVVRAFLSLREWAVSQTELAKRLAELEQRVGSHDHELKAIIQALREFLQPQVGATKNAIGFARETSPPSAAIPETRVRADALQEHDSPMPPEP